jgi:thymidylate synthase (FAD)
MNERIDCLDHGFVRLVDHMGDDSAIVQAARVSYGGGTKTAEEDETLIRYLMRNMHTSPFEMVEFKFHCKLPIFCARQMVRHRTASLNELSGRYSELPEEFYIPRMERVVRQSTTNKQGSGEVFEESVANHIRSNMSAMARDEFKHYHWMLEQDVARELSRINLPLSTYTDWYWKMDLHNLFHFLKLRLDGHAQYEIRVYAEAIFKLIRPIVPISCKAFENYALNAVTFSEAEMDILQRLVGKLDSKEVALVVREAEETRCISKRERSELLSRLGMVQGMSTKTEQQT